MILGRSVPGPVLKSNLTAEADNFLNKIMPAAYVVNNYSHRSLSLKSIENRLAAPLK